MRIGMSARATFGAGAVAALVTAGMAAGAIPEDGTFRGCVHKASGALRVIDAERGQACRENEFAVSWDQRGPRGETGPAGPAGVIGRTLSEGRALVPADTEQPVTVECPAGKVSTGGGFSRIDPSTKVLHSGPFSSGWAIIVQTGSGVPDEVSVEALCVESGA